MLVVDGEKMKRASLHDVETVFELCFLVGLHTHWQMIFDSKNNALERAKINLYNLKDYSKFNKKIEIPRPLVKNENFTSLSLVIMNYRQPLSHDAVNIRADCNVLTAQCQSFAGA